MGDARAIELLIYASERSGGERAKNAAIKAISRIGKPAVPPTRLIVRPCAEGPQGI